MTYDWGQEQIEQGRREAGGEPDYDITLLGSRLNAAVNFVSDELIYLWGQLWDSYQQFLGTTWMGEFQKRWEDGGSWSGRCEGLGGRIAAATEIVGPVSWRNVPMTALVDGWFTWANARIGITDPDLPSSADIDYLRRALDAQTE
jgi:hypothetical protein